MNIANINVDLFRSINDLGKQLPLLDPIIIFIAEYTIYLLALSVIVYWFSRKKQNRMMILCAFVTFAAAQVLGRIAGRLHTNNQPFAELPDVNQLVEHAVDNSFPSDHTMLFFSFCVTFLLFSKKPWLLWAGAAIVVGISRIWVGVHYPADVLTGALISILSAVAVYRVVPRLQLTDKALNLYERLEQKVLPKKM